VYRVYYINQWKATLPTRDQALDYINREVSVGAFREDFEILDESDF
jgi:hypothetical protein